MFTVFASAKKKTRKFVSAVPSASGAILSGLLAFPVTFFCEPDSVVFIIFLPILSSPLCYVGFHWLTEEVFLVELLIKMLCSRSHMVWQRGNSLLDSLRS